MLKKDGEDSLLEEMRKSVVELLGKVKIKQSVASQVLNIPKFPKVPEGLPGMIRMILDWGCIISGK